MSLKLNYSMSLANSYGLTKTQKIASAVGMLGLFILGLALFNVQFPNKAMTLTFALTLMFIGTIWFSNSLYLDKSKGIKNDGVWFKSLSARGLIGWLIGVVLTLIGLGISNYSSSEISKIKGVKSSEINELVENNYGDEVVHRNNFIFILNI